MTISTERVEIGALVTAMAKLLEGQASVSGWRAFLLVVADVLGDPGIADRDALEESRDQVDRYYRVNSRMTSDFVIHKSDRSEMAAANEELMRLRGEIQSRLGRATRS